MLARDARGIDHDRRVHRVQRLDDPGLRERPLDLLADAVVRCTTESVGGMPLEKSSGLETSTRTLPRGSRRTAAPSASRETVPGGAVEDKLAMAAASANGTASSPADASRSTPVPELAQLRCDRLADDSSSQHTDVHPCSFRRLYDRGMAALRDAQLSEATLLAELQEHASVAAFAHIFRRSAFRFRAQAVHERWVEALEDPAASGSGRRASRGAGRVVLVRPDWLDGLYVVPGVVGLGRRGRAPRRVARDRARPRLGADPPLGLEENARARRFYERRAWQENGRTRVVRSRPTRSTSGTRSTSRLAPMKRVRFAQPRPGRCMSGTP